MTPELEALWAHLLDDPRDAARLLVTADWLADHGRDPDLEAGLRWCARRGKWPVREHRKDIWSDRRLWRWCYRTGAAGDVENRDHHYRLPRRLWSAINGQGPPFFKSVRAARPITLVRRLGRALPARQRILAA